MARRGDKIICDNSYCGKVIPEQRFDCGKHSAPKELRPFVEANRRRAERHEKGKGKSEELWTPQKAHECVQDGKFLPPDKGSFYDQPSFAEIEGFLGQDDRQ